MGDLHVVGAGYEGLDMTGHYIDVPIDVATTPLSGEAICDAWWLVTTEDTLLFWSRKPLGELPTDGFPIEVSPQCNGDRRILDRFSDVAKRQGEIRQVPVVFVSSARRHIREMAVAARAERAEETDPALGP